MSLTIYYFSGTGNSLHVARQLQERIPEAKLVPMVGLLNRDVAETGSEMIGLVFPVYLSTLPAPVKKFVQKMDFQCVRYVFAVATYGGSLSVAHIHLGRILKEKGTSLDAHFLLKMINNSPTGLMPKYLPGFKERVRDWVHEISREKTATLEAGVRCELDSIHKAIVNQERHLPKDSWGKRGTALLMSFAQKANENKNIEIGYYTDSRCTGCGTCEKVCPSHKIVMVQGKPVWQEEVRCYYCYACFNFCPAQAILVKDKYTAHSGRYVHPEVTPEDIAEQKSLKMEARQ